MGFHPSQSASCRTLLRIYRIYWVGQSQLSGLIFYINYLKSRVNQRHYKAKRHCCTSKGQQCLFSFFVLIPLSSRQEKRGTYYYGRISS
ncbi:hypothetical protein EVA_02113 [gut metagenome]|uniref:Uncharacterized protein n=1 Tax=gut metagenome TaxID=749906 RepID=J9GPU5_9ZZZZ